MKDSGVEWIGEIPDSWSVSRLKYCAVLNPKCDFSHLPADAYVTFTPMELVGYGDFQNNAESLKKLSGAYTPFQDGDIALAKVTPCFENGKIAIMTGLHSGVGFGSSELFVIRAVEINTKFLFYFLQNEGFKDVACSTMTGTGGLKRVSPDFVHNCPIAIPSLTEQQRIAAYLDEQCAEIDKVLAKTRESIEEYKKLKQSVITEAVTKGIRPDRPMKPSGIEWIGDIPAEWEVRPFRTILTERNEKNLPAKTEERLSLSIDLGVTKYAEKTTNLDRFKEDVTQYKLAYPGDLVMNSMNMIVGAVGVSPYFGCVSPAYYTYYDKSSSGVAARFCDFLFRTRIMRRVLRSLGKGIYSIERGDDRVNTCRLKVAREDLRALKIPLPSETEQTEIVAHLDQQCAEIDRLIAKKEQMITELESYKKSLIYECVTGKREVAG